MDSLWGPRYVAFRWLAVLLIRQSCGEEYSLLVVGIGDNQFRAQVYEKAKALGYAFPNIITPSAYISPNAKVGCGCGGAAKRLCLEWCICRERCSAECRNGSPL